MSLYCSFALLLLSTNSANAALLLEIDLSQENIIAITATNNSALVNSIGSDFNGVYLEDFFSTSVTLNDELIQGNLVTANQVSDNSPNLFNVIDDLGLNIFSMTASNNITTTLGQAAFSGFAQFSVSADTFKSVMNGALFGNLHMNADSFDDLSKPSFNTQNIGKWAVVSEVSAPSAFGLMLIACFAAFQTRKRALWILYLIKKKPLVMNT